MRLIIGLMGSLFLYGCYHCPLDCRSESLYPEYLASQHILTPDPYDHCFFGQQIVIRWNIKKEDPPLRLLLHVRYGTREYTTFSYSLTKSSGYQIYRLINEAYWDHEGIISYKAEMYKEDRKIADWEHHLWTEIIEI
ncbi:MAG: hypothetical protein R3E91_05640 [Chlamydiales bacterium]